MPASPPISMICPSPPRQRPAQQLVAVVDDGRRIVDIVSIVNEANDDRKPGGGLNHFFQRTPVFGNKLRLEKQVFRRIAADAEFWKDDEVGIEFGARSVSVLENSRRVTGNIADDKIKLSESYCYLIAHA